MEAILLVGGLGTRLHPLTLTTAKPMLPLGNMPITEHQLRRAASIGIQRVILSTSYLSESFREYFHDGRRWGMDLVYAIEEEPLGTAGAIRNASQYLTQDSPVFVFNGDVISHHDLLKQFTCHKEHQADATLHLRPVDDVRAFGKVTLNQDLEITEFSEKPESISPIPGVINAGCYIMNTDIIDLIPSNRAVSIEREIFPQLLRNKKSLIGYSENSYWLDLGTPTRYLKANLDVLDNRTSLIGDSLVDSTANVTHSVIGSHVTVGANVTISNSLVLDGVCIGENSHISHTILGNHVSIAANSRLDGLVVGDNLSLDGHTFPQSEFLGLIETSEF